MAENQTAKLTGIPINTRITQIEERLQPGSLQRPDRIVAEKVRNLNHKVLRLLDSLINLKEDIINDTGNCTLYTTNYPLLVEHILREARWYKETIIDIEKGRAINDMEEDKKEMFWNQIMMEHAEFTRGLLDPLEYELMDTADEFANEYASLLEMASRKDECVKAEVSTKTLKFTEKYRDFKDAGTEGITSCNIRSVILPLLADHVLREASHYLRILKE